MGHLTAGTHLPGGGSQAPSRRLHGKRPLARPLARLAPSPHCASFPGGTEVLPTHTLFLYRSALPFLSPFLPCISLTSCSPSPRPGAREAWCPTSSPYWPEPRGPGVGDPPIGEGGAHGADLRAGRGPLRARALAHALPRPPASRWRALQERRGGRGGRGQPLPRTPFPEHRGAGRLAGGRRGPRRSKFALRQVERGALCPLAKLPAGGAQVRARGWD